MAHFAEVMIVEGGPVSLEDSGCCLTVARSGDEIFLLIEPANEYRADGEFLSSAILSIGETRKLLQLLIRALNCEAPHPVHESTD